eukprot:s2108_g9.t1
MPKAQQSFGSQGAALSFVPERSYRIAASIPGLDRLGDVFATSIFARPGGMSAAVPHEPICEDFPINPYCGLAFAGCF